MDAVELPFVPVGGEESTPKSNFSIILLFILLALLILFLVIRKVKK